MSDISIRYQTGAPQNLETRFAARAAGMLPSEIRSLFAVASRPEIVSLAGGMPNLSALPMEMMAGVVNELLKLCNMEVVKGIQSCANKSAMSWRSKEFALTLMMLL